MSARDTIDDIERKMAECKAQIDAVNEALAPHRAELEELHKQQDGLQKRIDEKVAEIHTARGDPKAWIDLKHRYAVLASTRMQLLDALKKAAL